MAEVGKWNGHIFTVKPDVMRLLKDLTIKGSSEYEYKKQMGSSYVLRKNAAPREVDFTVILDHRLNVDVREESMALVTEAYKGKKAYMYLGGKKLLSCKLMLTSCDVDSIEITPNGTWLYAECKLTLKQASKGSDAGDDGKKKKKSSKKRKPTGGSPKKKKELTWWEKIKRAALIKKRHLGQKMNPGKGNKAVDPNKKDKYVVLR